MMDSLTTLSPTLVPVLLFFLVAASCIGIPVPSTPALIIVGGFAATGDISLQAVLLAGFSGAIIGDQIGYALGRLAKKPFFRMMNGNRKSGAIHEKTLVSIEKWGAQAVFFSRWLLTPLGPVVNLTAGSAGFSWGQFTLADISGEAVWVVLYVGIGYFLSGAIAPALNLVADISWLAIVLVFVMILGAKLRKALKTAPSC